MKAQSNISIPEIVLWKEGQYRIAVNPVDNGVPANEEDEGKRYEADFTIIDALTAEAAIHAFTRMTQDIPLDESVIYNFEVNGRPAIETKPNYPTYVATTIFPVLPTSGSLKRGEIYSYANGAVMVVQDHERTIYTPEQTPALFSFYRPNPEGTEWIAGEQVGVNATRTYVGKTYKCLQAHQTQNTWKPDTTPALWQEVQVTPAIPVWVQPTGAHDAYALGARVHFPTINDPVYESLIAANVYSPTAYPQGWKLV